MLVHFYRQVRQNSLDMVKPLQTEDYVPQAAEFASPPKWNLAHTSWFFEEFILKPFKEDFRPFHPQFGFLFNSYYNGAGERVARPQRGYLSRPTVQEVMDYRSYVDEHMLYLLNTGSLNAEQLELVTLGLNHEQQHQELFFTDLKYNFSVNPLFPAYGQTAYCEQENLGTATEFIKMEAGIYEIGHSGSKFCYDNERNRHRVFLEAYEICPRLVTNGEYLQFIEDGGYSRFELWHDEGLVWIQAQQIDKPMYWHKTKDGWQQFTLAGLRPLQANHILTHITWYEAAAFARWKGMRLPTEFEWEAAADKLEWGLRWEWTESAYQPYPCYKIASGTVGEYNGKFMVNQKVLRGGSVVTPVGHSRKTYRNFFHPHLGYQFNGIRLAKGMDED